MDVKGHRGRPGGSPAAGRRRRTRGGDAAAGARGVRRAVAAVARRPRAVVSLTAALLLGGGAFAYATYMPGMPPAVDPGTPTFAGSANPVPAEPAAYDPTKSMMQAIFDADPTAGGAATGSTASSPARSRRVGETTLITRGRALYMYTHNAAARSASRAAAPGVRAERPPRAPRQSLYTIAVSG